MQRIFGQLPDWARPDHPILKYELARQHQPVPVRTRYIRAIFFSLLTLVLIGAGYVYATNFLSAPPGENLTDSFWRIIYFPLLGVQLILRIGVLSWSVGSVEKERRQQTWDNLRATESGAELTLRTRWAAMFYFLRRFIGAIIAVRILLILGILYELTAFRGGYLDMLTVPIVPEIPLPAAVVLLALVMTSGVLLPLTGLGMDAAIGLFISTVVKQRVYSGMLQILLILLRAGITLALLIGTTRFLVDPSSFSDPQSWLLVGAFAAIGDWGLLLLQLSALGEIWAKIPYAVFFGAALLLFVMIQAAIIDALLAYSVRHAERHD